MSQQQVSYEAEKVRGIPLINGHLIHDKMKGILDKILEANENNGTPDYEIRNVQFLPEESNDGSIGRFVYETKMVLIYMVSLFKLSSDITKDKMNGLSIVGGAWLDLMFVLAHEVAHAVAWKQDPDLVKEMLTSKPQELEDDCNEMAAGILSAMAEDDSIDMEPPEFKDIPFIPDMFMQTVAMASTDPELKNGAMRQLEMFDNNCFYSGDDDEPDISSVKKFFLLLPSKDETSAQGTTEVKFESGDPAEDKDPAPEVVNNVDPFQTVTAQEPEESTVSPETMMLENMQVAFDKFDSGLPPDRDISDAERYDEAYAMSEFVGNDEDDDVPVSANPPAAPMVNQSVPVMESCSSGPVPGSTTTVVVNDPPRGNKSVYQTVYEALNEHIWRFCHPANVAQGGLLLLASPIQISSHLLNAAGFTKYRTCAAPNNYRWVEMPIQTVSDEHCKDQTFGVIHPIIYKNSQVPGFALFHAKLGKCVKLTPQNPNKTKPSGELSKWAIAARNGNKVSWISIEPNMEEKHAAQTAGMPIQDKWAARIQNGVYEKL